MESIIDLLVPGSKVNYRDSIVYLCERFNLKQTYTTKEGTVLVPSDSFSLAKFTITVTDHVFSRGTVDLRLQSAMISPTLIISDLSIMHTDMVIIITDFIENVEKYSKRQITRKQ